MSTTIIALEAVAFIAFLIATILAFLQFIRTRAVTNIWFLYTLSFLIFTMITLVRVLEEFPDFRIFWHLESMLLLIGSTLLFSAKALYQKEKILCQDCYEGDIKKKSSSRHSELEAWLETF